MKRETYDYSFNNQNNQPAYSEYTIANKNQSFFSILDISGGYQYHLNNRISFIAQPIMELPLTGIGFGKISLNSAGLLFTAVIKPFKK
jgi:hypothetical protein